MSERASVGWAEMPGEPEAIRAVPAAAEHPMGLPQEDLPVHWFRKKPVSCHSPGELQTPNTAIYNRR